ncbi:MAG: c-type cytochrome [Pseudomonadota bacterium]|nr:c-type cytochrome [Pseudomonadota bacterium]
MSAKRSSVPTLVLASLLAAPVALAADAAAGKAVFDKLCVACHSLQPGAAQLGPPLQGVVGRKAASVKEFTMYTPALKAHNVTWNAKTLDEFLASPTTRVPGTMMVMPVTDTKERADLIEFLSTLKAR